MTATRRMVLGGAFASVAGLAIAATSPTPIARRASPDRTHAQQTAGGVLVVAGWALLGWGVHRFGRERIP